MTNQPIRFEDLIDRSNEKRIMFKSILNKEIVDRALELDESLLDETGMLFVYDTNCPYDLRG